MNHNEITGEIIVTAIEIHRRLGPGLFESVYRRVLAYELRKKGFKVIEERPIPLIWDDVRLDCGFRADLIVQEMVIVEVKSMEAIAPVHKMQLLTHLRLADKQLGLVINFNVALLKEGIARVVNGLSE